MTKNVVYINNTYPQPLPATSWQSRCLDNLNRYFDSLDCDLHVLGVDNQYIQQLENFKDKHAGRILGLSEERLERHWSFAVLRKHAKLMEFLHSNYERALFCDLDCLAVSENIFDFFDEKTSYVKYKKVSLQNHNPAEFPMRWQLKFQNSLEVIPNLLDKNEFFYVNTELVSLSLAHAAKFHRYLADVHLNPFEEDDYVNLLNTSLRGINNLKGYDGPLRIIDDEFLLLFAVNAGVLDTPSPFPKEMRLSEGESFQELVEKKPIFILPYKQSFPIEQFAELGVLLWNQ